MRCAPGVHEAALALLQRHCSLQNSVLDLGAGSGAFVGRLRDNGFTDLHAVELDAAKFRLDDVRPVSLDLNVDFARQFSSRFDLITALEIIEHLDSPRLFLRQVHQLLPEGGMLLVSTPNVAHWAGRLRFLLRGELRFFDEALYHRMRHISPITDTQMRLMLHETGFAVLESRAVGESYGPLTRLVTAPVALMFRLACGPAVRGDVMLYIARRTEPMTDVNPTPGGTALPAR
jgi:2-polyprenyl-3-methyl-5-hydroxy-6-metoxy-1,4-benzoquinol methylase